MAAVEHELREGELLLETGDAVEFHEALGRDGTLARAEGSHQCGSESVQGSGQVA